MYSSIIFDLFDVYIQTMMAAQFMQGECHGHQDRNRQLRRPAMNGLESIATAPMWAGFIAFVLAMLALD